RGAEASRRRRGGLPRGARPLPGVAARRGRHLVRELAAGQHEGREGRARGDPAADGTTDVPRALLGLLLREDRSRGAAVREAARGGAAVSRRTALSLLVLSAVLATARAEGPPAAQAPTFSTSVEAVYVDAVVLQGGRPVSDLRHGLRAARRGRRTPG